MKLTAAAIVLAVTLAGCSSTPPPESGFVRDKRWDDHVYETRRCTLRADSGGGVSLDPTGFGNGSGGICIAYDTTQHDDPDTFDLLLENCEGDDGCDKGWRRVTQDDYGTFNVGDWYGPSRPLMGDR